MKYLKYISVVLLLLFVTGCNETKNEVIKGNRIITIETGKVYYDKNNMYNGSSLNKVELKEDGTAYVTSCGKEAGCSLSKGTYKIMGKELRITLTSYQDITGEWEQYEEKYITTNIYQITDKNEFSFTPDGGQKELFTLEK